MHFREMRVSGSPRQADSKDAVQKAAMRKSKFTESKLRKKETTHKNKSPYHPSKSKAITNRNWCSLSDSLSGLTRYSGPTAIAMKENTGKEYFAPSRTS